MDRVGERVRIQRTNQIQLGQKLREEKLKVTADADRVKLVLSGCCPCSRAARGEPRGDQDTFRGLRLSGSVPLLIFNAGAILKVRVRLIWSQNLILSQNV